MTRRLLLVLLLLAGTPRLASSGESSSSPASPSRPSVKRTLTGNLTLDQAVQIALLQNPQILNAFQDIERTRGQIIEVRAQALPHLTMTGDYSQQDRNLLEGGGSAGGSAATSAAAASGGTASSSSSSSASGASSQLAKTAQVLQQDAQNNGFVTADQLAVLLQQLQELQQGQSAGGSQGGSGGGANNKSWNVNFTVRQVLYAGGQVRAALNIANFSKDSSYWNLRDVVDQVISTTRTQFYQILLNRALITVQEETIQLLTNQLRDQQNRFEAGTVPRFNVLRAEVELSNVRPNLIRARNDYIIAQLQLAKTLGLNPGPGGKPAFNAVGVLAVPTRPMVLANALQLAKERRPFLKVQRQTILIETENIQVALAGYKPRLDADAGYTFRNSRLSNDLGDVVNGWFFGVSGSWNIFDGLETYGRTKQARARLQSAKINYDDSVQQVELEVQQAFAQLNQAFETIQSQQRGVEQAVEALRLATERFEAGAGTQLEVLDARVALTRAQITELQARADYNIALADFDRATATTTVYSEFFKDPLTEKQRPKMAPGAVGKSAPKTATPSSKTVLKPREG